MSTPSPEPSCCPCDGQPSKKGGPAFATILNSDLKRLKASPYKAKRLKKFVKQMPETFNPMDRWGFFLTSVRSQGNCGACWAMATAKALSDRYSILSLGELIEDFSPYAMIACEGTIFPSATEVDEKTIKRLNLDAHTSGACNGNTLEQAMNFLFCIGCVTTTCVNQGLFSDYGIPALSTIEDPAAVPICTNLLGPKYETCLDRKRAARYYRTIVGYEVDKDVESIKQEIYKWGPVVTGMRMFDNFVEGYDGVSIYMGPAEDSQSMGGHAVEIVGWGKEGDVDFWWICNSWGAQWGMSGYFRMKMKIKECELEDNVVSFIPDFPGFSMDMIDYDVKTRSELKTLREWMEIDNLTGYQRRTLKLIEDGKLKGNVSPIFTSKLPDMRTVWLGDVKADDSRWVTSFYTWQKPQLTLQFQFNKMYLFVVLGLFVISIFIANYLFRKNKA